MTRPLASRPGGKSRPVLFASYLRCSTDDQAHGDFTTINTQRDLDRAYIDRRIAEVVASGSKAEYAGEFSDEGRTGTNLKRPGWIALLEAVRAGTVNTVVITYVSRLARGEVYYAAEYLLKEAGAKVETVQQTFTDDTAGRMHKKIEILGDGLYVEKVSEHTRTKQQSMVAMGYWTGGYPRFGYRSETAPGTSATMLPGGKVKPPPKRLFPFEPEAQHVRQAMQVFILTRNMGAVLRYLRESVSERRWTMDKVRALLTDDVCRGVLRFGANVNHTAFEPIVSEQLWDAVQNALQSRQEARDAETNNDGGSSGGSDIAPASERPAMYSMANRVEKLPYYLRGVVFCPYCGNRMTPTGAHGRSGKLGYYVCVKGGSLSKSDQPCPVRRVNAARLHDAVLGEIARVAEHPTRLALLLREAVKALPSPTGLKDELARDLRNRREADRKIARLVAAIVAGGGAGAASITAQIAAQEAVKAEVEKRIADIESRIAASTAQRPDEEALRALWGAFLANWEYLTEGERTELLPLLVERVTMEEKEKGTLHLYLQSPPREGGNSLDLGCGGRTRTADLWVMSPTSYQLLHPASTELSYHGDEVGARERRRDCAMRLAASVVISM